MHADRLPFLVSLPRAGTAVPPDAAGRIDRPAAQLVAAAEPGLTALVAGLAAREVAAPAHRWVVDLTRDPAGGEAVPTRCDRDEPLYRDAGAPGPAEVAARVAAHHAPYHEALRAARRSEDLLVHFQVVGLAPRPGARAPDRPRADADPGYLRPEVLLANHGGPDGSPVAGTYTSCPREHLLHLRDAFEAAGFEVRLNDPDPGGYDVQLHGRRWYAGIGPPVVLLGIRRDLFADGTAGPGPGAAGADALRLRLRGALSEFTHYLQGDELRLASAPPARG